MNIMKILETMDYGKAPENTDNAMNWIKDHNKKFGLFIDGEFEQSKKSKYFYTFNPATGEKLAQITQANKNDVDKAVKAANLAQKPWAKLTGFQRAKYLYAIARLIQKHARLFAVLESLDNGKPIRESRDVDIPLVIRHFYHHAGWAQLMEEKLDDYQAIGVAGQIIPWNFPLLMMAWKIAPALAAGNAVVLKPAEYTSLTALLFAEICQQAGLPKGVGSMAETWTKAMSVLEDVREVMVHAAPTSWTQVPIFEAIAASQRVRKAGTRRGVQGEVEASGVTEFAMTRHGIPFRQEGGCRVSLHKRRDHPFLGVAGR